VWTERTVRACVTVWAGVPHEAAGEAQPVSTAASSPKPTRRSMVWGFNSLPLVTTPSRLAAANRSGAVYFFSFTSMHSPCWRGGAVPVLGLAMPWVWGWMASRSTSRQRPTMKNR